MNLTRSVVILVLGAAAAIGTYVATLAWQPPPQPRSADGEGREAITCDRTTCYRALAGWLGLSAEQTKGLESLDPKFFEESAGLERTLFAEREKLADLFDDPQADKDAILQQVDRVIAANGALERRVAAHLVALRSQLTDEQRHRLFQRCAQGIRDACGCGRQQRWRCGKSGPGVTTFGALCAQAGDARQDGPEKPPAPPSSAPTCGHEHRGGEGRDE